VCDRSIGFSIDVTSNILSIYTMIGLVVSIATRRALIAVLSLIAIFFSFTRNVSLPVCTISALVTLIVAAVVVSGHFD
jgi:hypothetical protein